MFKQRLISGIVLVIIAVITLYFGGFLTLAVVGAISLIGDFELLRVIGKERSALAVMVYSGSIFYYVLLYMDLDEYILPLALLILILILAVYVFTYPKYEAGEIALSYFTFFYVTVMLSYIYRIRALNEGVYMIVLVFLAAWGNDTLAYCSGRLFGKHKMSPILSPKKTIEGAVGGIVGAFLLGAIYGLIAKRFIVVPYSVVPAFCLTCGVGGAISIIGDLAASAIKRNYGIKDYSNLIPGHGGILDRFDSIIVTAPIIYYLLTMVVGLS
ncbi:MAG: phosphatidate cytidylyltransferase [Lachnospiraceae bacterium]|nr:phosphatidate cytidylyltransferase [Lachnospiraceae bacterium]